METVTSCVKVKDWTNKEGKAVPIYKVETSDGKAGESFGTEIPAGTPAEQLDFTAGQYGDKVKWNKPNGFKGGGGRPMAPKGNESFAMSYAKDLVIADKVTMAQLLPTADKIFDWLESKKKA